jgi:DNA-binding response OmpR family regulator
MSDRVLLVEGDLTLVATLTSALAATGYSVRNTASASEAVAVVSTGVDLIVLDATLPQQSGFALCRELRTRGIRVPILMLSGRGGVEDKIRGLKLGADDCVGKPFDMSELLARIEALLRRWRSQQLTNLCEHRFGSVAVNFGSGRVVRNGVRVNLSAKELRLLRYLIARRGAVVGREELLRAVWGQETATRTLDVHIAALRAKLEDVPHRPRHIQTVRGEGYVFRD